MRTVRTRARLILATVLLLVGAAGAFAVAGAPAAGAWRQTAGASAIPAPAVDETVQAHPHNETAVLAGGCFWGVQGVFQHVNGVIEAQSGYTGGDASTAHYETVSTGTTGHAESVRIIYDPSQITFGELLRIYFAVVVDPTQLNGQGPDEGSQYRSAIFAQNPDQRRIAQAYIGQLNRAAVFSGPIVTTVSPPSTFYPAEAYHQNFLASNPDNEYIALYDEPKLDDLKRLFPDRYRETPVLVAVGGN
jgi:peptide-methionine (S)-S-oxide reductase